AARGSACGGGRLASRRVRQDQRAGGGAVSTALPPGFRVRIADSVRVLDGGTALIGGSPTRLLRLKPRAAELLASGVLTVTDAVTAALARRLLDAGIACPALAPAGDAASRVTVVIPVHDNRSGIDRLLPALEGIEVIVVDDGSPEPVRAAGARVIRHDAPHGPAAARNRGLAEARTELVAFLASDTVPRGGWLEVLAAHFSDPAVALAAPRIAALDTGDPAVAAGGGGILGTGLARYEEVRSSLDLGPVPGPVVPGTPV